jgi:hypothetical protein
MPPDSVDVSKEAVERAALCMDTLSRLRKEAALHDSSHTEAVWCRDAAALLRALQSKLEAAERDAERLHKLAATDATLWIHDGGIVWETRHGLESLCAVIDAASKP